MRPSARNGSRHRDRWLIALLLAASVAAMLSIGGGFFATPLLIPAQWWAARRASGPMRLLWTALASLLAAEMTWGITFVAVGEREPVIWLLPLAAGLATMATFANTLSSRPRTQPH